MTLIGGLRCVTRVPMHPSCVRARPRTIAKPEAEVAEMSSREIRRLNPRRHIDLMEIRWRMQSQARRPMSSAASRFLRRAETSMEVSTPERHRAQFHTTRATPGTATTPPKSDASKFIFHSPGMGFRGDVVDIIPTPFIPSGDGSSSDGDDEGHQNHDPRSPSWVNGDKNQGSPVAFQCEHDANASPGVRPGFPQKRAPHTRNENRPSPPTSTSRPSIRNQVGMFPTSKLVSPGPHADIVPRQYHRKSASDSSNALARWAGSVREDDSRNWRLDVVPRRNQKSKSKTQTQNYRASGPVGPVGFAKTTFVTQNVSPWASRSQAELTRKPGGPRVAPDRLTFVQKMRIAETVIEKVDGLGESKKYDDPYELDACDYVSKASPSCMGKQSHEVALVNPPSAVEAHCLEAAFANCDLESLHSGLGNNSPKINTRISVESGTGVDLGGTSHQSRQRFMVKASREEKGKGVR